MEPQPPSITLEHAANHCRPEKTFRRRPSLDAGTAVVYAALVAVLLERMSAVAADLQLWADGAWFLIRIASTRSYYFWVPDWKRDFFQARIFTILWEQTPLVLATHLRIHSLHALSLIFGFSLYSHALLSLYICYRYASRRWYMLFPLLSFFAGTMNVEAYLATDSHFIVSLYWPVLFILLFGEELTGWTLVLLLGLSIPMVVSYESMMFFGVILAGVCIWRRRRSPQHKSLLAGLAAWYLLGAALAAASVIWPFDAANRDRFARGLTVLLQSQHLAAKVSLVVLLCCVLLLAVPSCLAGVQKLIAAVGLGSIGYLCLEVLLGRAPASLNFEVSARVLNLLLPLAATFLLIAVLAGWFKPDRRTLARLAILVGALGLGQAYWNFGAIMRWQGMLATLRYELLLHQGPVAFDDSILSQMELGPLHLRQLHAGWPLLPLSLYEAGRGQIRSIIVPEAGTYWPFDPFDPATLPDLSRYRMSYDSYRAGLKRNWRYSLGERLIFSPGGSAGLFTRGQWLYPEGDRTWGVGPDFGLDLPLPQEDLPERLSLWAVVAPNLAPGFADLSVQVTVNNVPVGKWTFQYSSDPVTSRTVQIPKAALTLANPARIRFHVLGAIRSPAEMGKGPDPRKQSLAFLELTLDRVQ
ncbi:MAG: hypothetical protein WAL85_17195 [Candidatus Korobacteraceae bacterium]